MTVPPSPPAPQGPAPDGRRRVRHKGPVMLRGGEPDPRTAGTTTDQRLLDRRGQTDWLHTDPWRVLRIQSEFVEGFGLLAELPRAVSVFGSARTPVDHPHYAAGVAIGAALAQAGYAVVTGGGPGAMEAANLGAYLSPDPASLPAALELLAAAPGYRAGMDGWVRTAFAVRERWPVEHAGRSLSVPTWFYGHEPTNVFATGIAKYFANAVREDTLLHRCRGGIVYLPGQAGTVQEIFQAATENFYAADPDRIAPMVLVGVDYWTTTYPAWPLLQRLAAGRPMEAAISCVDSVSDAAELLL
jgi:predicted Rossmann-fold nucleotide-binding protein